MFAFACSRNFASMADLKEILISCSYRTDYTKNLAWDLIIRMAEMQKSINLVKSIFFQNQIGKEWYLKIWDDYLGGWIPALWTLEFPLTFLADRSTPFLLPEENNFPFHGDHVMISRKAVALQDNFFSQDASHRPHYLQVNNQNHITPQLGWRSTPLAPEIFYSH